MTSCNGIEDCRTVWTIVWSCLVTVMACTWVAIHLNIPSPSEDLANRTLRRIGIMMMAVVLPEFVVGWAARQYIVAGRLAKYHDHKWTRTHGFFALMGGFMLYDGDQPIRTLTPVDLETLVEDGSVDFPSITEEEIKDRSKGDALSKGVALVHTSWFTIQVIARSFHRLPTTELEVVTLAFTVLNLATYWLWWNKPLGVQCPFRVPLKSKSESHSSKSTPIDAFKYFLTLIVNGVGITLLIALIYIIFIESKRGKRGLPSAIALTVLDNLLFFGIPFSHISRCIFCNLGPGALKSFLDMGLGDQDEIEDGAMNVPAFYAGKLTPEEGRRVGVFILPTIAIAFGAIHCIAWDFDFPTHIEQWLWRRAATTITCAPVVMVIYWALKSTDPQRASSWLLVGLLRVFVVVTFFFYVICRIILLALALSSLRSLPHGAFHTIAWTGYIPHL
ncbi:hypothetical protein JAAARDRAFT_175201 [Jaapia argillacea MUCL 33604]|uniref:Uncharacterized protein n=1 Tax=Jaapia argillacea MUCL 33604 TaxID=933084 RepID=A0A067PY14_9AGAM|nr:hypothetical protein JAAARDRAFT_175201 [Jaapia argillacea MUCL 33604]